ncbi:shikimate kinase [Haladaptatus litoreus]|uniref:Shikimate kinase n=1 Tax=Haladaptatus litoreus TaxID=553468 RepID=A0A1N6YA58_9EURY|nr:shikimate kinase [Haladaptatus litoreus]SIR11515.1 shikimate kinase [Haladaptatus litoreus]
MNGRATAPAAGTVLNALATGVGSAFAIDADTTAEVSLDDSGDIRGEIADAPDADTRLIERCVELVLESADGGSSTDESPSLGATVRTESDVPMASGLKSSSAAANATVMATLSALDIDVEREDEMTRKGACRLGVQAARDVGVTATGAFDDASASMLGGVTVTDNDRDELLSREEVSWDVLVYTPPEQAFSADADVERCQRIAPMAELVADLALDGDYGRAMTVNGFAFCGALGFSTDPLLSALPDVDGVSLSGTGPSYVAVGGREILEGVQERWESLEGTTWLTTTQTDGTRTI